MSEQDSRLTMGEDPYAEAVTEPAKRKRGGRVKGSKNKPKDKPTEPVTEADAKSLREFIREITTGEEFRNGLKDRLKTGKLTAGESRLVEKILDSPVEKKKEGWQELIAVATEAELVLLADLMRRAIAARGTIKPKSPTRKRESVRDAVQVMTTIGAALSAVTVADGGGDPAKTAEELRGIGQRVTSNQVLSGSEPGA